MIVSCPSCASRYRIRDEKISARGARITCPSCAHKFVVQREEEPLAVGAGDSARGVPVTFARAGKRQRSELSEEDDEADVPTTVMPHGSQLAESIRLAALAKAQSAELNREPEGATGGGLSSADTARGLRAATRGQLEVGGRSRGLGRALGLMAVGFVTVALLAALLVALGVLPFPGAVSGG